MTSAVLYRMTSAVTEMGKRIKPRLLHQIRCGSLGVIDDRGTVLDDDVVFESHSSNKKRVLYNNYIKMSLESLDLVPITNSDMRWFLLLVRCTNERQVIDFSLMEERVGKRQIEYTRSSLRKAGLIDKVKLDAKFRWFMNPHVFSKTKYCRKELLSHFNPLASLIKS